VPNPIKRVYKIIKQERGFWSVQRDGNKQPTRVDLTKKDALTVAHEHAGIHGSVYIVEGNSQDACGCSNCQ